MTHRTMLGRLGLVALVGWLLAGCSEDQSATQAQAAPPPSVSVLPVSSKPFTQSVEFIGETEAWRKVDIRARVTGFLVEQVFSEGTFVEEGDVLYRIDSSEFDAALASARAGLESARATLVEADQRLTRTQTLAAQDTVSEAVLDEAVAAQGKATAAVAAEEASVTRAELDLGYTEIRSPIAGRIGKTAADVGNLIGPDSGVLATVIALDPIRVVFSASEQVFLNVQQQIRDGNAPNMVPRIRLANGNVYEETGTLQFADNQVDPSTGTIRVYMTFPNPDRILVPGLFVTVMLSSDEVEDRVLIPQSAVQLNQSGPFVLVVNGESRVETRSITTGDRAGADIVVTEGLTEGESIIVDGIQKVRPGAEVAAVPAVSAAAEQ